MLNVLLTNDDGIEAEGLQAMRAALAERRRRPPGGDRPRRQPLGDGALDHDAPAAVGRGGARSPTAPIGYATDGTPVDCVRLASLGLVEGFAADLVVSGINHGANLGDDITYSGTVAAALEGVVLGLPAIAVSQQSRRGRARLPLRRRLRLRGRGGVRRARSCERIEEVPLPRGHAAERQRPRRASPRGSR